MAGDRVAVMLHGLGSDAPDLASLAADLPQQYVYASLRGIHRWNDGWAWLERWPLTISGRRRS